MQYRTMRISVYSFIISAILLTASCSSINKKCKDITFGELSKDVQDTLQCVSQKVIEEDYSPKAMIDFSEKSYHAAFTALFLTLSIISMAFAVCIPKKIQRISVFLFRAFILESE